MAGQTQYTKPTIYYTNEIERLQKQVAMLKQIISELTANDDGPLPFATLAEDAS